MRALGLDPGLAKLAWGAVDEQDRARWGTVTYGPTYGSDQQRIDLYEQALHQLLQHFRPDVVGIEHQFCPMRAGDDPKRQRSMARAAMRLSELRAVLLRRARHFGCRVVEVAPATVKKLVAGHGRAEKSKVQDAVKLRHGINDRMTEDESDAVAIADTALAKTEGQPRAKPWTGELFLLRASDDSGRRDSDPVRDAGAEAGHQGDERGNKGAALAG